MNNRIYVDKLTFRSILFLLRHINYSDIRVLEGKGVYFSICKLMLSTLKKKVVVEDFSFATLRNSEGKCSFIDTTKKTTNYSFKLVDEAFQNNANLQLFDNELERPLLRLVSLKLAQQILFPIFQKLTAFNTLKINEEDKLLFTSPGLGLEKHLKKSTGFQNTIILKSFKNTFKLWFNLYFKFWLLYHLKNILGKLFRTYRTSPERQKNASVLLIQDEDVHDDQSLRKLPLWNSLSSKSKKVSTLILKNHMSKKNFGVKHIDKLQTKDIFVVDFKTIFEQDINKVRSVVKNRISKISAIIGEVIKQCRQQKYLSNFFLLIALRVNVNILLSARLSIFLDKNNTKTIVLGDVYHQYSEISFLCGWLSTIPVISYQYSSLYIISPGMLSIADFHLTFSNLYHQIYKIGPIQPKKFHAIGYPRLTVNDELRNRANQTRIKMHKKGVKTIISYFDENFFTGDKWAHVNDKFYLEEIEKIFKFIIKNPEYGLILKPQYTTKTIKKHFNNVSFVAEGFSTGRIVELCYGFKLRNLVLPAEAGLASDFGICSKIGMTTAIELAALGQKAILLNNHGILTPFEKLLDKGDIQYQSIDKILEKIIQYKDQRVKNTLGDWSAIISEFVIPSKQYPVNGLGAFVKRVVDEHNYQK